MVERSAIVLLMEYVPRKATITRFGAGACERAMKPHESESMGPVLKVYNNVHALVEVHVR
jgi:hypothetical protein